MKHFIHIILFFLILLNYSFAQLPVLFQDSFTTNSYYSNVDYFFKWKNNFYMRRYLRNEDININNIWRFDQEYNATMLTPINMHNVVTSENYIMVNCSIPFGNIETSLGFTKTGNEGDFIYTSLGAFYYGFAKNDTFYVNMTARNNYYSRSFYLLKPTENGIIQTEIQLPNNILFTKHFFFNDKVFLIGIDPSSNWQLFKLQNNQIELVHSQVTNFFIHEDNIYISSYDNNFEYSIKKGRIDNSTIIWKTLKYYNPNEQFNLGSISDFIIHKNMIYFKASFANNGEQLGNISNDTIKIVSNHTYQYNNIKILGQVNDLIIYEANSSDLPYNPKSLWASDGTREGNTMLVNRLEISESGPYDLRPRVPAVFKGRLYFMGNTRTYGEELWITDGTSEGTKMVMDLYPGTQGSKPSSFTTFNDRVYFMANGPTHGRELWYIQPTCFFDKTISGISIQNENARNNLISTQEIRSNTNILYQARNSLTLNPGFQAEKGSVFSTKLEYGCEF